MQKHWHVYMVRCSDGTLYTGIAIDVMQRIAKHNRGLGAKSLKGKLPVTLVYSQIFDTGTLARKREYEIKQWKRSKKLSLIQGWSHQTV